MSQKIENNNESTLLPEKEFPRGFLLKLIILAICVFSVTIFSKYLFRNGQYWFSHDDAQYLLGAFPQIVFVPWQIAAGKTISNGLILFNGKLLTSPSVIYKILTLVSIYICYIFVPTFFIFKWYRYRIDRRSLFSTRPFSSSSIGYGVSILFFSFLVFSASASGWVGSYTFLSMKHAQSIQTEKDRIIVELNLIDVGANQYRILPKNIGGGEGSYEGFVLTSEQLKTQSAIYTLNTKKDEIVITAQSLVFPSGKISQILNEKNAINYQYYGLFR